MSFSSARLSGLAAAAALVMLAGACAANPGPPPVEDTSSFDGGVVEDPGPESNSSSDVVVGVDPVTAGFNPHLMKDDSVFVRTLTRLVLPSAFVDGQLNKDLLESVEEIPAAKGAAMSLRYKLNPQAQWNDGTPITVADFEYVATNVVETPGAKDSHLYREISSIESAEGGREVTVHLKHRVADYRGLFSGLLPSHHMRGADFEHVMDQAVPASAGRYTVGNIDRQRGVVVLNRNDRFWGEDPAAVEIVEFREIRSTFQAVEQFGSGQLLFADIRPTQTNVATLKLIEGTQMRQETSPLTLTVAANAALPVTVRENLLGLIDVAELATLATESQQPQVGAPLAAEVDPNQLRSQLGRVVRIGVDPTDSESAQAAEVLRLMYQNKGLKAMVVEADSGQLFGELIPTGKVDVFVGWLDDQLLPRYQCGLAADDDVEETSSAAPTTTPSTARDQDTRPPRTVPQGAKATLGTNPSGFCDEKAQQFIDEALAGDANQEEIATWAEELEKEQHLTLKIVEDRRVQVAGFNILGPSDNLNSWPKSMDSLLSWRNKESTNK